MILNMMVDNMDMNDQMTLCEVGGVGMGNAFNNTQELHTITYTKAMKSEDKLKRKEAAEEEYKKMENYKAFKLIPTDEVDKNATVLSSKWVMKKMTMELIVFSL